MGNPRLVVVPAEQALAVLPVDQIEHADLFDESGLEFAVAGGRLLDTLEQAHLIQHRAVIDRPDAPIENVFSAIEAQKRPSPQATGLRQRDVGVGGAGKVDDDPAPPGDQNLMDDLFRERRQRNTLEGDIGDEAVHLRWPGNDRRPPENHARQAVDSTRRGVKIQRSFEVGGVIVVALTFQHRQVFVPPCFDSLFPGGGVAGLRPLAGELKILRVRGINGHQWPSVAWAVISRTTSGNWRAM